MGAINGGMQMAYWKAFRSPEDAAAGGLDEDGA
jgi:hypothetical protein